MTTDPTTPPPDDSAAILADVEALASALADIDEHVTALEAQVRQNPTAPVSTLDLSALRQTLDEAVAHAQAIDTASAPASAGTDPSAPPVAPPVDPALPVDPAPPVAPDPGTTGGGAPTDPPQAPSA